MKLGLIADLHGDVQALENALKRLDALAVGAIVCAGDLVGYGHHPDAVARIIRERAIPCVRGNHDRWALERRQVLGPRGWSPAALRDATWETLANLPPSLSLEFAGRAIEIHHGSPASDVEFITPYRPMPQSINEFWPTTHARILILGHTHIPMVDRSGPGLIVNPGSIVGVPGVQTSYSFSVLDLADLSARTYEVKSGREIRRDPIYLGDEPGS